MHDRHEVASDASSVGRWHVSINMCMHGKQTQEDKKTEYCRSTGASLVGETAPLFNGPSRSRIHPKKSKTNSPASF